MREYKFEKGDVVRLNSNNVLMTICDIIGQKRFCPMYTCIWFDREGIVNKWDFEEVALSRAEVSLLDIITKDGQTNYPPQV